MTASRHASPPADRPRPVGRETMEAIVQDAYGSADVLELRDIDKPEIADDEVLVRVHAAGVDAASGTS